MTVNEIVSLFQADMVMGIIGIILLVATIMVFRTKGKTVLNINKTFVGIVTAGLFVAILWNGGYFGAMGFGAGAGAPVSTVSLLSTDNTIGGKCLNVEDTTVTLSATDKYTTVATGGNHRYSINGDPALTVADAGTFTASPLDTYEILLGNETIAGYFGAILRGTVPCSGTEGISAKLVQNGSMTISVFDENADAISASNGEALANGDVTTLEVKLKAQFQRGFPYGGILVGEYSKGFYDDIRMDLDGEEKVSTPSFYALSAANHTTVSYKVPALESNQEIVGSIVIDVDDTDNPTGNDGNISLTYIPYDYFINEDTGGSFDGPALEDERGAQTFLHQTPFTLTVS